MRKPIAIGTATFIILLFFHAFSSTALADTFAEPEPTKIELENGSKVFFMTPLEYVSDEYPPTGLYYNTDPPDLIYLVTSDHAGISYFHKFNVLISDNGMHFVHLPIPWHNDNVPWNNAGSWSTGQEDNNEYTTTALEFYSSGNLIKKYTVSDLVVDNSALEFSVTMVMWEKGNRSFDSESNELTIKTVDGISYTFDITTGAILESDAGGMLPDNNDQSSSGHPAARSPVLWIGLSVLGAALVVILVIVGITRIRKGE